VQFRLTRDALEDLGLSVDDYASQPATEFQEAQDVVRLFVERRTRRDPGRLARIVAKPPCKCARMLGCSKSGPTTALRAWTAHCESRMILGT
jgi:hypothetical protein